MAPPPFLAERVRGVVFDLDGTLIDSYRAIAISHNHARAAFGLPALSEDDVRLHVGRGLESLVADLVGEERVDDGVRLFRERYATAYADGTTALPGAGETLRGLRERGFRMAIASNKPARFCRLILEDLGWLGLFDSVQGPDLAGHTKPDPTMIRLCLDAMEISPREGLYVGDMVLDVESASRAGLPVVLVSGGSSSPEALRETGLTLLPRLETLLGLLPPIPLRTERC